MHKQFRPMLACQQIPDLNIIKYPKFISPKLDGIRCIYIHDAAYSRNMKLIPNKFVQAELAKYAQNGYDGELFIPGLSFNKIQSLIMSEEGEPDFQFIVFDKIDLNQDYSQRIAYLENNARIKIINNTLVYNQEETEKLFRQYLDEGYEGAILRDPYGPYKQGRSTLKEEYLLKLKDWQDAEAIIVDFVSLKSNTNTAKINKLGLTERSSKKEGLKSKPLLGKLIVKDVKTNKVFEVGSGFTAKERKQIWRNKKDYIGKHITYKWQAQGMKDLPRFPIFKGFRKEFD